MILFLVVVVATALVLQKVSLRLPLRNVTYRMDASVASAEQGEEFHIVTTIENHTKRNISYLRMCEGIPASIHLCDGTAPTSGSRETGHVSTIFVRKRERVRRSVRAVSYRRGLHRFQKSELSFGDFLGFKEITEEREATGAILIYPRRIVSDCLNQVVSDIMGEVLVQSFLYEDPILVRGYREYTGREPLRQVSFMQSAKCARWMVKEFDHTRTPMVNILLDMEFYGEMEEYFDQREAQFSAARMVCEQFMERGMGCRLITNMCYPDMETRGINVIESEGGGGFYRILDCLSVASGVAICPSGELLSYAKTHYGGEGAFLYIAQRDCDKVREVLAQYFVEGDGMLHTLYGSELAECYRAAV